MTSHYDQTPQSVSVLLPRMRSLPSPSVFLTVKFVPIPYMSEADRVTLQYVPELEGVVHAVVTYGFAEVPNISSVLTQVFLDNQITVKTDVTPRSEYDLSTPPITYYLSRERIRCAPDRWIGHKIWVKIFDILQTNSRSKADVFNIPSQEIVEVGYVVTI